MVFHNSHIDAVFERRSATMVVTASADLTVFPFPAPEQDASKPVAINEVFRRWIWFGLSTVGNSVLPAPLQKYGCRARTQFCPLLEFKCLKSS
jgi:hypothetical protein